eukprot:7385813-Prymnesium_polylepis.1
MARGGLSPLAVRCARDADGPTRVGGPGAGQGPGATQAPGPRLCVRSLSVSLPCGCARVGARLSRPAGGGC